MARIYRKQIIAGEKLVLPSGTPVDAVAATGVLTFSGVTADGETVTIGSHVYEFDTDDDIDAGHIAVDISGGATAAASCTALVAAINGDAGAVVIAAEGDGDTVNLTAKVKGAAGNEIATTETCANGSFAKSTLTGGINGTVADKGEILFDSSKLYVAVDTCTVSVSNWKEVALS
jgi:phage tail sheath gpL-like